MGNIKILIVEDSKTFNNIITSLFDGYGYETLQAFTLKEAKEKLHSNDIDYIMLDLNLPDGNGEEVIDSIKEDSFSRIIVMTGDEDTDNRDRMFEKGIVDYFIKTTPPPIIAHSVDTLIQALESHKNINILTIDESDFMRTILRHILELKGYNVLEASSAPEGKEILKNNEIHLILLDLIMPGINGIKFLEDIKSDNRYFNIPVIVVSADQSRSHYARVLKEGANDFIKKPFIVEEILLKCDVHIESYLNQKKLIENEKELLKQKTMLELRRKEIKKQNIYHRNLIEASLDPLFVISKGKITDVNQAAVNATGIPKYKLKGTKLCSYFTMPKEVKERYDMALKDGKVVDYPLSLKHKDGSIMDVLYNAVTYSDDNGDVAGVVVTAKDVTEINKFRSESEQISKFKAMSALLDNISHHWRQPLTVISTSTSGVKLALEMDLESKDEIIKNIDKTLEYSKYLSDTIDDFRQLFKNYLEKSENETEKLIGMALDKFEKYIKSNNIEVVKNIDNFMAMLYENEFIQIISNIIENIEEHAKDNKYIFISVYKEDTDMVVKIKDNGGGVSEELLDKIFEAYFTTKHKYMGKGMGLYVVHQMVQEYFKGTVEANNDTYEYEGKTYTGLELTITIPMDL